MWNIFEVNYKDIRTKSGQNDAYFSSVSIVNFEQVNDGWEEYDITSWLTMNGV